MPGTLARLVTPYKAVTQQLCQGELPSSRSTFNDSYSLNITGGTGLVLLASLRAWEAKRRRKSQRIVRWGARLRGAVTAISWSATRSYRKRGLQLVKVEYLFLHVRIDGYTPNAWWVYVSVVCLRGTGGDLVCWEGGNVIILRVPGNASVYREWTRDGQWLWYASKGTNATVISVVTWFCCIWPCLKTSSRLSDVTIINWPPHNYNKCFQKATSPY